MALEIESARWWPAEDATGNSSTHLRDECREPLWGAPRIHDELLMLGVDIGQTTVAKYMVRLKRPSSQRWKTLLHNHADGIASMDLFVVPTISFHLLYGFLILRHSRRDILWLGVTAHPSAEWIARQLTEAYGWQPEARYIVRDRDCVYGDAFLRRLRAMGIEIGRPQGSYQRYYNDARTHLSLNKDTPASRAAQAVGRIVAAPHLRGLHHQYVRI